MRLFVVSILTLFGCSLLSNLQGNTQPGQPPIIASGTQINVSPAPTSTSTLMPSPSITPTAASTAEAVRQDLLGRINALRATQNLPPYKLNPFLVAAADQQAEWLVNNGQVVHIHDGSSPGTRAEAAGYPNPGAVSENIYMGQMANVDFAWDFWINSKIHYAGLISPYHDEIGIGTAHNDIYGQSFVLVFGASGTPWPTRPPATPTTGAIVSRSVAPLPTLTPTYNGTGTVYVVQPGDTLYIIATRNGTTVDKLAAANGITNPDVIEVGQTLIIP
jgi:uncharacterized protein YkwD